MGNGDNNSMTIITPAEQAAYWSIRNTTYSGVTQVGETTGVSAALTAVWGEGEAAYLGEAAQADDWPPLPDVGEWLEIGQVYQHGEDLLVVRQSHNRTHHDPVDVPALFTIWRPDDGETVPEWVAGEWVYVGTRRQFEGTVYEAIQPHVTQADWTPPAVPALWQVVNVPDDEDAWRVGVFYAAGTEAHYRRTWYRCLQSHTSQADWTPPNVPALWQLI
jgi:hypothetical protein